MLRRIIQPHTHSLCSFFIFRFHNLGYALVEGKQGFLHKFVDCCTTTVTLHFILYQPKSWEKKGKMPNIITFSFIHNGRLIKGITGNGCIIEYLLYIEEVYNFYGVCVLLVGCVGRGRILEYRLGIVSPVSATLFLFRFLWVPLCLL